MNTLIHWENRFYAFLGIVVATFKYILFREIQIISTIVYSIRYRDPHWWWGHPDSWSDKEWQVDRWICRLFADSFYYQIRELNAKPIRLRKTSEEKIQELLNLKPKSN